MMKKLFKTIFILVLCVALSACSLALPGQENLSAPGEDMDPLIGLFLAAVDHASPEGDAFVPGQLVKGTLSPEGVDSGDIPLNYAFGNLRGVFMGSNMEFVDDGVNPPYFAPTAMGDVGLLDNIIFGSGSVEESGGRKLSMSATLYLAATGRQLYLIPFPVYRRVDGNVYLVCDGLQALVETSYVGGKDTFKLSATRSTNVGGITSALRVEFEIVCLAQNAPREITILQMDKDNVVIRRESFAADAVPQSYPREREAEYIILESRCWDFSGVEFVERTVFSADEKLEYYALEDDFNLPYEIVTRQFIEDFG